MRIIIVNLGSKGGDNNYNSSPQVSRLNNSLLMSIIDTPEKDLSNSEGKSVTRKFLTSLVESYSTLFSCSVRAMYNRVNSDQNQRLKLK